MTGGRGTPGYAAPELWMSYPVTHKCDVYSYGMLLFEIIGRRRNHDMKLPESQEWFPLQVWNKFVKDNSVDFMGVCGIEEKDREMAGRMVKVALWCVQYRPESRPWMSLVVKMLEGGLDIPTPTNPFRHLLMDTPPNLIDFTSWTESGLESASSQMLTGSASVSSTPIMRNYEIERASA